MNSEQREEVLAVIKKDANGRGKLCRTYRGEDRMASWAACCTRPAFLWMCCGTRSFPVDAVEGEQ